MTYICRDSNYLIIKAKVNFYILMVYHYKGMTRKFKNTDTTSMLVTQKRNRIVIIFAMIGVGFFVFAIFMAYLVFSHLPSEDIIRTFQPQSTVQNFSEGMFENTPTTPVRSWAPLARISKDLQKAVLISEDDTFYYHSGVNWQEMKKAFRKNIRRRKYVRGASTITMQLARNAFLSKEKTLIRKIREIIVARRIEKVLSKNRIFELYLNIIEWGPNIYGAEAAARYYFDKPASILNMAESSMLAAILPNPNRFSPFTRMITVKKFQKRVLTLLKNAKIITPKEFITLSKEPVYLRGSVRPEPAADIVPSDSVSSFFNDSTLIK